MANRTSWSAASSSNGARSSEPGMANVDLSSSLRLPTALRRRGTSQACTKLLITSPFAERSISARCMANRSASAFSLAAVRSTDSRNGRSTVFSTSSVVARLLRPPARNGAGTAAVGAAAIGAHQALPSRTGARTSPSGGRLPLVTPWSRIAHDDAGRASTREPGRPICRCLRFPDWPRLARKVPAGVRIPPGHHGEPTHT